MKKGYAMTQDWQGLSAGLKELLSLEIAPIAITFLDAVPSEVPVYEGTLPAPTPDGRTGKVAAGCVFWVKAADRTFATLPADHGNCSVGSMTHGFKTMQEVAGNADVAALLASGWVSMEMVPQIPVVRQKPQCIAYGPLADTRIDPDVVLLRLNPKQVMIMHDALPGMRMEGKPQCHIIALAKEQQEIAASVGCMLSRVRTGLPNSQMTCAIPARRLAEVVERLKTTGAADTEVAAYAAEDARRFA
jgi:uncharacterized protein (DUF169 family)